METKRRFFLIIERRPVSPGRFQQRVGSHDIGFNKRSRAVDRPVNMAFRRQMHHVIRLVLLKNAIQRCPIADIHSLKGKALMLCNWRQRHQVSGVGELIHHHYGVGGFINDVAHNGRADKSRAASDQNPFHQRQTPFVSTM